MKIIAIGNQKGGTAKTTTTAALGLLLSRSGQHVHLVDMDPQCSLSQAFGYTDSTDGLYEAFREKEAFPVEDIAPNLTLRRSADEKIPMNWYLRNSLVMGNCGRYVWNCRSFFEGRLPWMAWRMNC